MKSMKAMKVMKAMKAMKATKKPSIGPSKRAEATPLLRKAAKHIHWTQETMKSMNAKRYTTQEGNTASMTNPMYGKLILKSSRGHAQHCLGLIVNVFPVARSRTGSRGPLYQVYYEDQTNDILHRDQFIVVDSPVG